VIVGQAAGSRSRTGDVWWGDDAARYPDAHADHGQHLRELIDGVTGR
jgi:hypothetical protein